MIPHGTGGAIVKSKDIKTFYPAGIKDADDTDPESVWILLRSRLLLGYISDHHSKSSDVTFRNPTSRNAE